MPNKRIVLALIGLLILASIVTVTAFLSLAQDSRSPFVYLYNTTGKELVRVYSDGRQQAFSLGLDQNIYTSSHEMAFSADGSRVSFCTVSYPPEGAAQGSATLYVRDIAAMTNVLQLDLGSTTSCRVGRDGLNLEETRLAVAMVNYYPGDPAAETGQPSWQLMVLDAATGAPLYELNANSPAAAAVGIETRMPILPYVRYFASNQIIFVPIPFATDGFGGMGAYLWELDSGAVTAVSNWDSSALDTLDSTGELVWLAENLSLPAGEPGGPAPAFNAVMLADKTGQARMVYHSPDWLFSSVRFINDGQGLAMMLYSGFDINKPMASVKWVMMDRAGNVTELRGGQLIYADVAAVPGGYTMLWGEYLDQTYSAMKYHLDYAVGGQAAEVWAFQSDNPGVSWELAWAAPVTAAGNLPPFPSFAS